MMLEANFHGDSEESEKRETEKLKLKTWVGFLELTQTHTIQNQRK